MTGASQSVAKRYQEMRVQTASPGELLLMLYDGAIRFAGMGLDSLDRRDYEAAHHAILRVQDIVAELMGSLNLEAGPIAQNLWQLYSYMNEKLIQSNLRKDVGALVEVRQMLDELRQTWAQVARSAAPQVAVGGGINMRLA